MSFAVLPAPAGYLLVTIDDDDGEPIIEKRMSRPEIVLGFVVHKQEHHFSVCPVTASGVHDEFPEYVLIRPDGKAETSGMRGNLLFESIEDWKQFMRREAEASFRAIAEEFAKDGDEEGAADMRAAARAHRKEIEKHVHKSAR